MRDEFTNHVGNTGYTEEEAKIKKAKVDDAYSVGTAKSKWSESEIVPDPRGGYMVVIKTL